MTRRFNQYSTPATGYTQPSRRVVPTLWVLLFRLHRVFTGRALTI